MGSKKSSRPGGGFTNVKMPLPVVVVVCVSCLFLGYTWRGSSPGKAAEAGVGAVLKQEVQAEKAGEAETTARTLLADPLPVFPHGASGRAAPDTVSFQILSWHPRALIFPRFAPKDICEKIVARAKKSLAPSGLALRKGESDDATKDIRTSSGTFLTADGDPSGALAWVEERMAMATMIPREHGEAFNVLRYNLGQKYDAHYDTFNPEEYGPQQSNRVASFLLYLTDVEEGGETMFPFEDFKNMDIGYNFKDCLGLKVKPKQGDALLFYSMHLNGSFDASSLHGSCPVVTGEKWVATKWIRDKSLRY